MIAWTDSFQPRRCANLMRIVAECVSAIASESLKNAPTSSHVLIFFAKDANRSQYVLYLSSIAPRKLRLIGERESPQLTTEASEPLTYYTGVLVEGYQKATLFSIRPTA